MLKVVSFNTLTAFFLFLSIILSISCHFKKNKHNSPARRLPAGLCSNYFIAGSPVFSVSSFRPAALAHSQMGMGAIARASTVNHWGAFMGVTENTPWRGGTSSTDSCMASPARKARFMAGLDSTPFRGCSL